MLVIPVNHSSKTFDTIIRQNDASGSDRVTLFPDTALLRRFVAKFLSRKQLLLLLSSKVCNLSTGRYAYANRSRIFVFQGAGHKRGCGMLVDFEVIKRRAEQRCCGIQRNRTGVPQADYGAYQSNDCPSGRCRGCRSAGSFSCGLYFFPSSQLRTAEVFEPWLYRLTVECGLRFICGKQRRLAGISNVRSVASSRW